MFVRDVNGLSYAAVNEHCDGCKMDEAATYFEYVKGKVDLKLRKSAEQELESRLNLQLKETWLKYLVHLYKMVTSAIYLLYMNVLRRDECYQLGCYEYMYLSSLFHKEC